MPRKKKTAEDIVIYDDGTVAFDDYIEPKPDTVTMIRADKGVIEVPADQVEKYKASSWKIV